MSEQPSFSVSGLVQKIFRNLSGRNGIDLFDMDSEAFDEMTADIEMIVCESIAEWTRCSPDPRILAEVERRIKENHELSMKANKEGDRDWYIDYKARKLELESLRDWIKELG